MNQLPAWKTYYIISFILILTPLTLHGQVDTERQQELDKLMFSGRYFESKELYKNLSETTTIPSDMDLFYKFRMAQFLNKTDSVTYYLEKFIPYYSENFGNQVLILYSILFDAYIELGDKDKVLATYQQMKRLWEETLSNIGEKEQEDWQTDFKNLLPYIESVVNLPPVKMKRGRTSSMVDVKEELLPVFQAKYNGVSHISVFDTGVQPYCALSKRLADEMGLRYDSIELNKVMINGSLASIRSVIDSIEIGNITFYNIPALIYQESESFPLVSGPLKKKRRRMKEAQFAVNSIRTWLAGRVALGLPIMKLIGKIQTDYEQKIMCFPVSDTNAPLPKEANIYAYEGDLNMRMKLNGLDFMAKLDTGSDSYITVDSAFYEKYQKEMPIGFTVKKNAGIAMMHQAKLIPYKSLKNPAIMFDDKLIQPPTIEAVKVYPVRPATRSNTLLDGVVGNGFYRSIGKKVLLDLDNMRLEAVQ